LPGLDVARAPVVQQDDAEQVPLGVPDGDRLAEARRRADDEADLALDVEPDAGPERRPGVRTCVRTGTALSGRADDVSRRDDDRPGASVVADRKMPPGGR